MHIKLYLKYIKIKLIVDAVQEMHDALVMQLLLCNKYIYRYVFNILIFSNVFIFLINFFLECKKLTVSNETENLSEIIPRNNSIYRLEFKRKYIKCQT